MTNRSSLVLILTLLLSSLFCSKESTDKEAQLQASLMKLSVQAEREVDPSQDEMRQVLALWNKQTGQLDILNSDVRSLNFIPLLGSKNAKYIGESDSYTVDCCGDTNVDLVWSKTCTGKFSCGSQIYDCLESGGGAQICKTTIIIIPPTSTTNGFLHIAFSI